MKKLFALLIFLLAPIANADYKTTTLTADPDGLVTTSGTVTCTISRDYIDEGFIPDGDVAVYTVAWTSDASGNAVEGFVMSGKILKVVTDPGATAPTANYDITLVDESSLDVAEGFLANRHTSNSEVVYPVIEDATTATSYSWGSMCGLITITVANAGSAKVGEILIYVEK